MIHLNHISTDENRLVFQKPNPFPNMSIYDNVIAGLKLNGLRNKDSLNKIAERSLKMAYLWETFHWF